MQGIHSKPALFLVLLTQTFYGSPHLRHGWLPWTGECIYTLTRARGYDPDVYRHWFFQQALHALDELLSCSQKVNRNFARRLSLIDSSERKLLVEERTLGGIKMLYIFEWCSRKSVPGSPVYLVWSPEPFATSHNNELVLLQNNIVYIVRALCSTLKARQLWHVWVKVVS